MLGKLLKYDFKSVFKLWWIAAISSFALSLLGGFCITVLRIERNLPRVVNVSAGLILGISIVSVVAFSIISTILIFVRYYKNFFTDEGYLTFTLPVKCSTLINSKVIMAVVTTVATLFVLCIDLIIMLGIGLKDIIFKVEFWQELGVIWQELLNTLKGYFFIYLFEGIVILILSVMFTYMFLYCCITLASVITKKARVITAIGIYYGVNCVVSFIIQMLMLFGLPGIIQHMASLTESQLYPVFALVLLCAILFTALICAMMYALQYWMLDKKLNLS